jgi:hypothetical protein
LETHVYAGYRDEFQFRDAIPEIVDDGVSLDGHDPAITQIIDVECGGLVIPDDDHRRQADIRIREIEELGTLGGNAGLEPDVDFPTAGTLDDFLPRVPSLDREGDT